MAFGPSGEYINNTPNPYSDRTGYSLELHRTMEAERLAEEERRKAEEQQRNQIAQFQNEAGLAGLKNNLLNQYENLNLQVYSHPLEQAQAMLGLHMQRANNARDLANMRMQAQRMQLNAMQQGNVMNQNYGAAIARRLLGF